MYDFNDYIDSKGREAKLVTDIEKLTDYEKQEEFMFMGLRMTEGIIC